MKTYLMLPLIAVVAHAADVRQVFRAERYERGNVNISPLQPIDEAAWVWLPGQSGVFIG